MGVGRSEPISEGLVGGFRREHRAEVAADFFQELAAGGFGRGAFRHEVGRVLGEVIERPSGFFEGVLLAAVWGVGRGAGAPDLIGLTQVIAGVAQEQRVGRDGFIPDRALEDGAAAGAL